MKIYTAALLCTFPHSLFAATSDVATEVKPTLEVDASQTETAKAIQAKPHTKEISIKRGSTLHGEHCIACHENMTEGDPSSLYTREDRNVSTLNGLTNQVQRCVINLKLDWFDDEIHDVSNYLNAQYYHY